MTEKNSNNALEFNMPLEKFLSTCFLVPMGNPIEPDCIWGLPVMLHGSPGIGKTARVRQASSAVGLTSRTVNLGGRQPEDASGAPFVAKNAQGQDVIVIACILGAVNELNAIGQGVVFFDELTCARPATQGAFLSAMDERRVGDTQFSQKLRVVCAGNPPEESAGGYILQPPMANRMAHRNVQVPSIEEYTTYLIQGPNRDADPIHNGEVKVVEAWPDHYPKVLGQIAGFVERFKAHLYTMPKSGSKDRGKAFPTPRTLEYAARSVATARILGRDSSEETELFAACVGAAAAVDWETWLKEADLPDPRHVLEHGWKPDKIRLDRTIAVYSGIAAYVLGRQSKEERLELAPKVWLRLNDLITSALPDMALPPARALVRAGFSTKASKEVAEAARPVMLYFGKKGFQDFVEA
jgi:hypothetical protein